MLQVELASRGGRIGELEQGAVSREQFEEVQKELQDQRLETRLAQTRCEELLQHCEELVSNPILLGSVLRCGMCWAFMYITACMCQALHLVSNCSLGQQQ